MINMLTDNHETARQQAITVEAGLAFCCPKKTRSFLTTPLLALDGDTPLQASSESLEDLNLVRTILYKTPEFRINRPALAAKLGC
jgi:hypothetical protein